MRKSWGSRFIQLFSLFIFFGAFPVHADEMSLADDPLLSSAELNPHLCYLPGAGAGNHYTIHEMPEELEAMGIPTRAFDVAKDQSIEETAEEFARLLQVEIERDPGFRCHVMAYSMGGLVTRYAAHHLSLQFMGNKFLIANFILSFTSFSSPHLGTPLVEMAERYLGPGLLDPSREQLSAERVAFLNDPESEFYSPEIPGVPNYSYVTFIKSQREGAMLVDRFGYAALDADCKVGNRSSCDQDGTVPTFSQHFGKTLGRLQVPHSFFGHDNGMRPRASRYLARHWDLLQVKFNRPELDAFDYFEFRITPFNFLRSLLD